MKPSNALFRWSENKHWTIVDCEAIRGTHAASLVRVLFVTEEAKTIRAVYKCFAADRSSEAALYPMISAELNAYAPGWLGTVTEWGELGIVLEDVGCPIKQWLVEHPEHERDRLIEVAEWLAKFHAAYEPKAQQWLATGQLGMYPFASTDTWWQQAFEGMVWAQERGVGGLTTGRLREIRQLAQRTRDELPKLMSGRATLTHGDPHLNNILVDGHRFRLIDWEFACVSVPQRDLAVLLQDVVDPHLFSTTHSAYLDALGDAGWDVHHPTFSRAFEACLFDNTLMMIGWDIQNTRKAILQEDELDRILRIKLDWLTDRHRCHGSDG